jgi:hypothetical protein
LDLRLAFWAEYNFFHFLGCNFRFALVQFSQRVLPHLEAQMNLIRFHYAMQRAVAHIAGPIMRATGFRFSTASRASRVVHALICRVSANLLADGIKPNRVSF